MRLPGARLGAYYQAWIHRSHVRSSAVIEGSVVSNLQTARVPRQGDRTWRGWLLRKPCPADDYEMTAVLIYDINSCRRSPGTRCASACRQAPDHPSFYRGDLYRGDLRRPSSHAAPPPRRKKGPPVASFSLFPPAEPGGRYRWGVLLPTSSCAAPLIPRTSVL